VPDSVIPENLLIIKWTDFDALVNNLEE
jgi:hypothetical protein